LLDGVELLLIDGNNLLMRTTGSAGPGAVRALLVRLGSTLPPATRAIVMLDGRPAAGLGRARRLGAVEARHAGPLSADDALVELVASQPLPARALVISDDRQLRDRVRQMGAQTHRLASLQAILERPPGAGPRAGGDIGRRPPAVEDDDTDGRRPWQPGRGATRKTGNPRRRRRGGC
jgi:hypothetical protein